MLNSEKMARQRLCASSVRWRVSGRRLSVPTIGELFARKAESPQRTSGSTTERRANAGVCLSGGGYRAMLFHVGAIRRLYEIDALRHLSRISSVSGGSITAALLGLRWPELHRLGQPEIPVFEREFQQPLLDLASKRIDGFAVGVGVLTPSVSVADRVERAYRSVFGDATLLDLPDTPRFVLLATNLGTGSLVRFASEYTADYRVGVRRRLNLPLAQVVAASSAFPPVLSPRVITLDRRQGLTETFGDRPERQRRPWTHRLELTDGGVYDNLGLQPLESFSTILASDGGGRFSVEKRVPKNWLQHMIRSWNVTDNQVRSLRKRDLIDEYQRGERFGAYWGIGTDIGDYGTWHIPVDPAWISALRDIPTRLWRFPERRKRALVNWGYAVCDAAIRAHVTPALPDPIVPYPDVVMSQPPPKRPLWKRVLHRPII